MPFTKAQLQTFCDVDPARPQAESSASSAFPLSVMLNRALPKSDHKSGSTSASHPIQSSVDVATATNGWAFDIEGRGAVTVTINNIYFKSNGV